MGAMKTLFLSTKHVLHFLCVLTAVSAIAQQPKPAEISLYKPTLSFNGVNCVAGATYYDMNGKLVKQRNGALDLTIDKHRYVGKNEEGGVSCFYDSSVLWSLNMEPHHSIVMDKDSNILFLTKEKSRYRDTSQIDMDVLYTVNLQGKIVRRQSFITLADQLEDYLPFSQDSVIHKNLQLVRRFHFPEESYYQEFFHINYVQIIPPNPLEKKDSAFRQGGLLVSDFRNNFMAILDPENFNVRWFRFQPDSYGGQHCPQMLSDGRIIYFVNDVYDKDDSLHSEIRILNPLTGKTEWSYGAAPSEKFFSITQGYCQPLPNGNILVTVNNYVIEGEVYVMEVTPNKEIVWKWTPANLPVSNFTARERFYKVERNAAAL